MSEDMEDVLFTAGVFVGGVTAIALLIAVAALLFWFYRDMMGDGLAAILLAFVNVGAPAVAAGIALGDRRGW